MGRAAGESGHEEVGHGAFGGQTLVVAKLALDVRGKKKVKTKFLIRNCYRSSQEMEESGKIPGSWWHPLFVHIGVVFFFLPYNETVRQGIERRQNLQKKDAKTNFFSH